VALLSAPTVFVLRRPSDLTPPRCDERRSRSAAARDGRLTHHSIPCAASFMANTSANENEKRIQERAEQLILVEQLNRAERFNGRAAMLGIVIGILTEAITGSGIAHQIGLGALVDGYAACRTQFLPFCF
jgi:hypothetical protein